MKLDDLADRSEVFLPQYKSRLKELIGSFPKNAEKWFYAATLPNDLYHGDLVGDLPILLLNEHGKPIGGHSTVMLLSNTCDTHKSETRYLTVAQVRRFDDYVCKGRPGSMNSSDWNNHLRDIQNNILTRFFYIPAKSSLPASIVDFERVCGISQRYVFGISPSKRLASLSREGYYLFALKLGCHFLHAEPADVHRNA
jgi:hypothetical protein